MCSGLQANNSPEFVEVKSMSAKHFASCLFISSLVTLGACGAQPRATSQISHAWGETTRNSVKEDSSPCPIDNSVANKRVRRIAHSIALGSPDVFKNSLRIESFCFKIAKSEAAKPASTEVEQKTITFSLGILAKAQSDSQVASVIAHELAHVTLQHTGFGEIAPRVLNTPEGKHLAIRQNALRDKIKRLAQAGASAADVLQVQNEFAKTVIEQNTLTDKVYGEQNAYRNWAEQEADDVGAEFLVKGGYPIHEFANMLWLSSSATPQQIMECNNIIYNAWNNSTERPERGTENHPTTCWRAFHLLVDEYGPAGQHKNEAATCPRKPIE